MMSDVMAQKREIVQTTNSIGWHLAMQIAEEIAADAAHKVISCDDESQIVALQRKAQAAREFLNEFKARIDAMRYVEVNDGAEQFVPVTLD